MKRPEVSVIIPVYNTAKFLPKCIDSLRNQTLVNIEIICVDDGSTDGSGEILDQYAKKDRRIAVIHQKNAGSSAARNAGLKAAKGIYIGFSDSDDHSEPNMYETLVGEARKSNADVVICGAKIYPEYPRAGQWLYDSLTTQRQVFDKYDASLSFSNPQTNNFLWRTLIKTELITENNITFETDLQLGEDKTFLCNVYPHANRISVIPDQLYHYCWHREGSLMDTLAYANNTEKLDKHCNLVDKIADSVRSRDIQGERDGLFQWMIPFLYADFIYQKREDKIDFAKRIDKTVDKLNKFYLMSKLPVYMVEDYGYIAKFADLEKREQPLCSAIIYLDSCSKYVREMTLSIAEYNHGQTEFILINNGVQGKDYEHVKKLMEENEYVRLYNTPEHLKYYEALNKGLDLADGEYFFFMNSFDKLWHDNLISVVGKAKRENVNICMTGSGCSYQCYEKGFVPILYRTAWIKQQHVYMEDDTILTTKIFTERIRQKTSKILCLADEIEENVIMSGTEWYGKIEAGKLLRGIQKLTMLAGKSKDDDLYLQAYELLCSDFCKKVIREEMMPNKDYYLDDQKTSNQITVITMLYRLVEEAEVDLLERVGNQMISRIYNVLCYVVTERQKMLN